MINVQGITFSGGCYYGVHFPAGTASSFVKCYFSGCTFDGIDGNLGIFKDCYFADCNLTDRQAHVLNLSSNTTYPCPLVEVELSEKERRDIISFDIAMSAIEAMFGWAGDNCKWYHYTLMIALLSPFIYDFISIFLGAQ